MRILDLQEGGCVAPEANMGGQWTNQKYSIWLFEVINDNIIIRLELRLLDGKGWVPMRCERGVCFQTR